MSIVNSVFGLIVDVLLLPFRGLDPWFGMIFISASTAVLMLFVFRFTSNQEGIRTAKNRIKAHLLEIRLYKDSMAVSLKAQGNVFLANARYLGYTLKPLLVMIIPLFLILAQLNLWFGSRPLQDGEDAILKVKLIKTINVMDAGIAIDSGGGIVVETPPLRIEEEREVDWRLRAAAKGFPRLNILYEGGAVAKAVSLETTPLSKVSAIRSGAGFWELLLYPGEKRIPSGGPIESVEIVYPARQWRVFGLKLHWLLAYFVLSLVFGFALKRPFKIEI